MEYSNKYINCSRDQLISQLKKQVKQKRFDHILRVEETALKLAENMKIPLEKVSIVALLHDYAKDLPHELMLDLANKYWQHPDFSKANDSVWHGFAAAQLAKDNFKVSDQSMLTAIAGHTIGWFEMDDLFKVLYIADYIEPGRDFPRVEKARQIAKDNLDEAVNYKMVQTLLHLIENKQYVFPATLAIYNHWMTN